LTPTGSALYEEATAVARRESRPAAGKQEALMPFDIFVIGPMHSTGDAVTVPTHTRVIKTAVQEIVRRHALDEVTVTAPDDLRGSTIATDVFSRLDAAELVVADLSERSPNVFYELAFVDALGLAAIVLCDDETDIPFYF
jgi:hypothetical protein